VTYSGIFVTFEGGEGTGKSTQLERLAEVIERAGADVVTTREPGGTAIGEGVREILLSPDSHDLLPRAELLLYEAARAQLVEEVIRPALERGAIVLCDRFYDSTMAYQGYARGISLLEVHDLNMIATEHMAPDLTLVYDLPPGVGLERATKASGPDRLEAEALAFHERVAAGFRSIADSDPGRVHIVDASGDPEAVFERTLAAVSTFEPLAALLGRQTEGEAE
jgi:dTMP kinase